MRRTLLAAALVLAFAAAAAAQPVPVSPGPTPPPQPVLIFNPNLGSQFLPLGPPPMGPSLNVPLPGPMPTPGPPLPSGLGTFYYKSGGVAVGAGGAYPYDTGSYLLAGMDGLARSTGTFVMTPASAPTGQTGAGNGNGYVAGKCRSHSWLKPLCR